MSSVPNPFSESDEALPPTPPVSPVVFSGKGTLLVGMLVGALAFHVQLLVLLCVLIYLVATGHGGQLSSLLTNLDKHGFATSVALIAGAIATTGILWMCVRLRTPDAGEYLGLKRVKPWVLIVSLVAMVAFAQSMEYFVEWIDVDTSSEVMIETYKAAGFKPLFWIALIVGAPVYEEVFMRGFLFAGWRKTFMGNFGAILLISLIWTFMHLQYGPVQWAMIFLMGIVLGYARVWTGSLYAPIAMHALNNTIATIQLMRQASGLE